MRFQSFLLDVAEVFLEVLIEISDLPDHRVHLPEVFRLQPLGRMLDKGSQAGIDILELLSEFSLNF